VTIGVVHGLVHTPQLTHRGHAASRATAFWEILTFLINALLFAPPSAFQLHGILDRLGGRFDPRR